MNIEVVLYIGICSKMNTTEKSEKYWVEKVLLRPVHKMSVEMHVYLTKAKALY